MAKARFRRIVAPSVIGALFVFLAGRIAFTHVYPLPYDESYHFGLIDYYTQYPNLFATSQPAGFDQLGSIVGDASHLYHFLLSFPLEFIRLFTSDQMVQVWLLRSLNICLGLLTLYLVYRLARRFGLSGMVSALVTAGLAITPVFYSVFAQLNYDNLLLPLTLIIFGQTWTISEKVKAGAMPTARLLGLGSLLLTATLVKYSFLPIFAAVVIYLVILLLRYAGVRTLPRKLWSGFSGSKSAVKIAALTVFVLASGVWLQQYGTNVVRYGTPHPQCHVVLSVERCEAYGPWARNYELYQTRDSRPAESIELGAFVKYWARSMYLQVYSLVRTEPGAVVFAPQQSLRVTAKLIALGGLVCIALVLGTLWRRRVPWVLLGMIVGMYGLTLWAQNYSDYQNLRALVAIQGRYLLPVLPLLYVVIALGYFTVYTKLLDFMKRATAAGAQTSTAIARLAVRQLYAVWLMAVVKISGAARPTRGSQFIANT